MAEVIKMPRMSDTMTEGVIVSWVKKEGDKVKSGDVMAEVETDKATMELESYTDGTLLYIGAKEGATVPVDGVIAVIGNPGEDFKALLGKNGGAAPAADKAPAAQPAAQADKSAAPEPAGTENETVAPAPVADKAPSAPADKSVTPASPVTENEAAAPASPTLSPSVSPSSEDSRLKASPLAKKIAEDKKIDINQVKGTGDNGRIVKKDVENFTPSQAPAAKPYLAPATGEEGYEDVSLSQMRKTIAKRLTESKFSSPEFYLTMEIKMDRAIEVRKSINGFLEEKISFNDLIIIAVAAALRKHPKVNASWLGDKIRFYKHIHIGVAMAIEDGLVVPVVKFADTKKISRISAEVKDFAEKAKNKKLQLQDFEGNTFTISNLGMFGIEEFTAIINPPDACILAVGAIEEKPVLENGVIKPGNRMKVTLTCDHRVVDGATGAQFLQTFKQYLEEPVTILA